VESSGSFEDEVRDTGGHFTIGKAMDFERMSPSPGQMGQEERTVTSSGSIEGRMHSFIRGGADKVKT